MNEIPKFDKYISPLFHQPPWYKKLWSWLTGHPTNPFPAFNVSEFANVHPMASVNPSSPKFEMIIRKPGLFDDWWSKTPMPRPNLIGETNVTSEWYQVNPDDFIAHIDEIFGETNTSSPKDARYHGFLDAIEQPGAACCVENSSRADWNQMAGRRFLIVYLPDGKIIYTLLISMS